MSWGSVYIRNTCVHCGNTKEVWLNDGYTHNTNEMMRQALRNTGGYLQELGESHLYNLNGRPTDEVAKHLIPAMNWWAANRTKQRELNPENGWGDEAGAFEFWMSIAHGCARHHGTLDLEG